MRFLTSAGPRCTLEYERSKLADDARTVAAHDALVPRLLPAGTLEAGHCRAGFCLWTRGRSLVTAGSTCGVTQNTETWSVFGGRHTECACYFAGGTADCACCVCLPVSDTRFEGSLDAAYDHHSRSRHGLLPACSMSDAQVAGLERSKRR